MTEARPLLSCECVECPSHRAEREQREVRLAALTAARREAVLTERYRAISIVEAAQMGHPRVVAACAQMLIALRNEEESRAWQDAALDAAAGGA